LQGPGDGERNGSGGTIKEPYRRRSTKEVKMKKTIPFALVSVLLLTGILGMVLQAESEMSGPDLTVIDGSLERHWSQIHDAWYLTATAKNNGNEDVDGCFYIQWFVGGDSIGYSSLCYLDAGDTATIQSPYFTASGTQNAQVHIDCNDDIAETNENNNWESESFWFSLA